MLTQIVFVKELVGNVGTEADRDTSLAGVAAVFLSGITPQHVSHVA